MTDDVRMSITDDHPQVDRWRTENAVDNNLGKLCGSLDRIRKRDPNEPTRALAYVLVTLLRRGGPEPTELARLVNDDLLWWRRFQNEPPLRVSFTSDP